MSNENKDSDNTSSSKVSNRQTDQSQDAVRHEKDALHHKFHSGPRRSVPDEKNNQGSQAAQEDSVDMQQSEGQPEIPKVGSRDAPGG
jgi:hypothetical protein